MSDNGEQKAPTYDQVSTGPVYAIIGHKNVQQTGTVYMIPWIGESGERCRKAADYLQMVIDVGPMEAHNLLKREWFQQQGRPIRTDVLIPLRELLGAECISIYDGSYEVYLQRMEGWAPQRGYISPEWQDPRGQNYVLKNSIADSTFIYGPNVNHIVLVRRTQ